MAEDLSRTAVVIPTVNAGEPWRECLEAVGNQSLRPFRRLVIDSSSTDGTVAQAIEAGFEVRTIRRQEFNHGATRQWAVEYLTDCDFVVFLTQDAVLAHCDSLGKLVSCMSDESVAIAYGRQLPRRFACPIEAHARLFNYGKTSQRKDLRSLSSLGAKVFFCSNSFAVYRRSTLLKLGGFRKDLILGEDAEYAARAVLAGYANHYCAEATAYHSHGYTTRQILARYFDTGVFHARNPWLQAQFGSHGGEGMRFVASEIQFLASAAPWQIPYSVAQTVAKVFGYRLGRMEQALPRRLKRSLSMSPGYW